MCGSASRLLPTADLDGRPKRDGPRWEVFRTFSGGERVERVSSEAADRAQGRSLCGPFGAENAGFGHAQAGAWIELRDRADRPGRGVLVDGSRDDPTFEDGRELLRATFGESDARDLRAAVSEQRDDDLSGSGSVCFCDPSEGSGLTFEPSNREQFTGRALAHDALEQRALHARGCGDAEGGWESQRVGRLERGSHGNRRAFSP